MPRLAQCSAVLAPMPRLPPVMTITLIRCSNVTELNHHSNLRHRDERSRSYSNPACFCFLLAWVYQPEFRCSP